MHDEDTPATAAWRLLGVVPAQAPDVDDVRYVVHGRVAAALVAHDAAAPVRQLLRDHADAVERVFAEGPVLPARYGILVEEPDDVVEAFLAPNEEALASTLEEIADRVEVHVRVEQDEDAAVAEAVRRDPALRDLAASVRGDESEATYAARVSLGERIAQAVAGLGQEDVEVVVDRLGPLAVSTRGSAPGQSALLRDVSYLVDRDRFDELDDAVGALAEQLGPRVRINAVGPIPPYSFADLQVG